MSSARQFGLTVTGSSGGQELVLCPFHLDRHSSAWWNPTKELFYCAVCGFGLNAWQLANRLGVEYEEVIEWNAELGDLYLVDDEPVWELGQLVYHDYFRERGIHEKVINAYGVRWKNAEPRGAVIPLTSLSGEIVGVQYRFQDEVTAGTRYKIHGKVPPVWPMHKLKDLHNGCPILLFEGVWSAMRVATWLLRHPHINLPTFALLGAKANEEIVETLSPFNAVYLYDADEAGSRACKKMKELAPLSHSFITMSPDDMRDGEIENLLGSIVTNLSAKGALTEWPKGFVTL
jgi:hypothetical protein